MAERMLHLSKELHTRPRYGLGVDGKIDKTTPVGYEFYLERGDGKTYVVGKGRNRLKRIERAKPKSERRYVVREPLIFTGKMRRARDRASNQG
jgi:hypothetical protein